MSTITNERQRSSGVVGDERGAMIIVALFMAVLISGFMFWVIGIGDAIVYRERMQDAADAGAFSAAVVHARGMNIIVLINLIMAAALAILIALKLLQTIIIGAMAVCAALAFVTFGATLAAIPPLQIANRAVHTAHETLKGPIYTLLRFGHTTAGLVRDAMPTAATARSIDVAISGYRPQVVFGATIPLGPGRHLPTEDDDFGRLCEEGGEVVTDVVMWPLDPIIPDAVEGWLSRATGRLTRTFSAWFCGQPGSGSSPPSFSEEVEVALPQIWTTEGERCRSSACTGGNPPGDCESACRTAAEQERASQPPEGSTTCADDGPDSLCAERRRRARSICTPTSGYEDFVYIREERTRYYWREQVGEDEYVVHHTEYPDSDPPPPERMRDVVHSRRRISQELHPCFSFSGIGGGHPYDPTDSHDLCAQEPDGPPITPGLPLERTLPIGRDAAVGVRYTIRPHIYACHDSREVSMTAGGERDIPTDRNAMSPQRIRERDSRGRPIELGDDNFQVRFVVFGRALSDRGSNGVEVGNWGRDVARSSTLGSIRTVGRLNVAQAEFYYPSTNLADRRDWMWNMRWRARLRRFHEPVGGFGAMCGGVDRVACGLVDVIDEMIAH